MTPAGSGLGRADDLVDALLGDGGCLRGANVPQVLLRLLGVLLRVEEDDPDARLAIDGARPGAALEAGLLLDVRNDLLVQDLDRLVAPGWLEIDLDDDGIGH